MNLTIRENFIQEYIRPEHQLETLCRANPELAKYQQEIDSYLERAGSAENRMAVLGFLMESHLTELCRQLAEMANLVRMICR